MENYPRRILLAVTGLSPQIVTETLYALSMKNDPPSVPTEVHLITTSDGAKLAKAALLHPDGGQFHALSVDYPIFNQTDFSEQNIHIIEDGEGNELQDIRTAE